jgi:hypothetical protein
MRVKQLCQSVDNRIATDRKNNGKGLKMDIFPFVVGHESDQRNRRKLLTSRPTFEMRKTVRSNKERARRKSAASDQATRKKEARKRQIQAIRVRVAASDLSTAERNPPDNGQVEPKMPRVFW